MEVLVYLNSIFNSGMQEQLKHKFLVMQNM